MLVIRDEQKYLRDRATGKVCPRCGRTLKDAYRCSAGHGEVMYYALNNSWSTLSQEVAGHLISKGYSYEKQESKGDKGDGFMWTFPA
jgi:hypothetical protein